MAGRKGGPKNGKSKGEDTEPSPIPPIEEKTPRIEDIATEKTETKAESGQKQRMVTIRVSRVGTGLVALKRESAGKVKVGNVMIDGVEMELGGKYRVLFTSTISKLARSKTVHILG